MDVSSIRLQCPQEQRMLAPWELMLRLFQPPDPSTAGSSGVEGQFSQIGCCRILLHAPVPLSVPALLAVSCACSICSLAPFPSPLLTRGSHKIPRTRAWPWQGFEQDWDLLAAIRSGWVGTGWSLSTLGSWARIAPQDLARALPREPCLGLPAAGPS